MSGALMLAHSSESNMSIATCSLPEAAADVNALLGTVQIVGDRTSAGVSGFSVALAGLLTVS